jgi:hypothetical protein
LDRIFWPAETLGREIDEAADRVNDIIEVEYGNRTAGVTEAIAERAGDRALARGDGPDHQHEVRHRTILVQE